MRLLIETGNSIKREVAEVMAKADRATAGGGIATPVDPGIVSRLVQGIRYVITGVRPSTWFGPMQPLLPVSQESKGRLWDYPVGYNLQIVKRPYEQVSHDEMRALADNYDLLRLVIETRKDQIAKMQWHLKPRGMNGGKPDKASVKRLAPQVNAIKDFLTYPDRERDWDTWLRILLEDLFVIDAATIYPRMTKGGDLYSLDILDGSTINRKINADGRTPEGKDVAYQQIIKGVPMADFSRDELIYRPRNQRSWKVFGFSPVEQIIVTVNIALRRQMFQLSYYTEGNVPEALIGVPETWTTDQIAFFQAYWDDLMEGNLAQRRHAKFVPNGMKVMETKEHALKDDYDEWLARVICFCFSINPQPFTKMMNRATAETIQEATMEEGLHPILAWIRNLMNLILWKYFQAGELEFDFEEEEEISPEAQATVNQIKLRNGVISIDEWRDSLGQDPLPNGEGKEYLVYTGTGVEKLSDIINPPEQPATAAIPGNGDGTTSPPPAGQGGDDAQKLQELDDLAKRGGGGGLGGRDKWGEPQDVEDEVIKIKIVNADKIRDNPETADFTMGGNGYAWPNVCKENEIKIEKQQIKKSMVESEGHEFCERLMMKFYGWPYDKAHEEVGDKVTNILRAAIGKEASNSTEFGKLEKGKKKVNRINRNRKAVLEARSKMKKIMMKAFRMGKAEAMKIVAEHFTKAAEASEHAKRILAQLDLEGWAFLMDPSEDLIAEITQDGVYQALLQIGLGEEDLTEKMSELALKYAKNRAAELVGKKWVKGELIDNPHAKWQITESTRDMLRADVAQAIEEGWSSGKLKNAIADNYAFSEDRAEMISRTEIGNADMQGNMIAYKESGIVEGKEWVLGSEHDDDDECDSNADAGVIPLDEAFPSGDMEPLAHPRCVCDLMPVLMEGA